MVNWKKLFGFGDDRNDFRDEMRRREYTRLCVVQTADS